MSAGEIKVSLSVHMMFAVSFYLWCHTGCSAVAAVLTASIDEWTNGTNGPGLAFETSVLSSFQSALFSQLSPSSSTGVNFASLMFQNLQDSFARQADRKSLGPVTKRVFG